jgi:tRNA-Thr(GGU) m(6)t(6)A37 methyltransferase TsaA
MSATLVPIGRVHSTLRDRSEAPRQGGEGAPVARIEIFPEFVRAMDGIEAGADLVVLTWLHEARRDVLEVHPRGEQINPLTGVFATRSPDRPNPVGLHRVRVRDVDARGWLTVEPLEAIDGTPVVDLKPVLDRSADW